MLLMYVQVEVVVSVVDICMFKWRSLSVLLIDFQVEVVVNVVDAYSG